MKVDIECATCLVKRAVLGVSLATKDTDEQMKILSETLQVIASNFNEDAVPSRVGTLRERTIKRLSGVDPYKKIKEESNKIALSIRNLLEQELDELPEDKRFRKACLIAAAGNVIEFGISENKFTLNDLENILKNVEQDLIIDQIEEMYQLVQKAKNILFLTDNAGEIALDTLLVKELNRITNVTVAVKDAPILNDATMDDALYVGMDKVCTKLITCGADVVGTYLPESSQEFKDELDKADLIIAKGMGHFESLTELSFKVPVVHMFRTKCERVARYIGVPTGKNVILIRFPNSNL